MKITRFIILCLGLVLTTLVFNSCNDDNGYSLDKAWYSIATIRTGGYGATSFWMTLDSGTSLWPVASNVPLHNLQDKQRAFIVYTILSDEYKGYDHAVKVLDMKSILTKPIAENMGDENDEIYGTDPVDISDIWIGDGYLNIVFEFNYGGKAVHYINLIESENSNKPYFFELRHNAYDDSERYRRKGIVAFDLSFIDTNGVEVELAIQVNTFDGYKYYIVKYNSLNNSSVQGGNYNMESFIETR